MTLIEGHPKTISPTVDTPRGRASTKAAGRESTAFDVDVAIVGLGYVGLPTALAFHAAGRRVLGVDVDVNRLAAIRNEQADLVNSDRDRLSLALSDDALILSSDPALLATAAAVIVCVPTPVDAYLVPDL